MMRLTRFAWLLVVPLAAAQAQVGGSTPPLPAPGSMIDVGGWRLHLNCTGQPSASQPTVILEAGVGDFSVEWSRVQPGIAKFARVCSYDRAGDGWSDLGPHPRTFRQLVSELHTMLERAQIAPPYVFVGHSFGGWVVRTYELTYPKEVAAMVLVEGGGDNPIRLAPDGKEVHASDLDRGRPVPAVKTSGPLREADIPPRALEQMTMGLAGAAATANEPPRNKLPIEAQQMRTWALGQVKHVASAVNGFDAEELTLLRTSRETGGYPYGDMPLMVLMRGKSDEDGPDSKKHAAEHLTQLESVAKMSRAGKLIVAQKSGHHIQIDEPELVIDAVMRVLAAKRALERK